MREVQLGLRAAASPGGQDDAAASAAAGGGGKPGLRSGPARSTAIRIGCSADACDCGLFRGSH